MGPHILSDCNTSEMDATAEINEFFRLGHQESISLDDKHNALLTLQSTYINQLREDASVIFSAKRHQGRIRITPKQYQTPRPSPIRHTRLTMENALDPCRRLTNRMMTVRKPIEPVKIGIFNHGHRSGLIKIGIPVFDEMILLESAAPNTKTAARCDPSMGCQRSPIDIKVDHDDEVTGEDRESAKNDDPHDGPNETPCSPEAKTENADMEIEDASELDAKTVDVQTEHSVHSSNEIALALDILQLTMNPGTSELDAPSGFMEDELSCFSSATEFSIPSSVLN